MASRKKKVRQPRRVRRTKPAPEGQRLAEELRLARQVQDSLLPPAVAPFPGVEVTARFLPSRSVGGDFYDYFQLDPHTLGLYLGDVQGKGLEGAMYALMVSGLMRGLTKSGHDPASLVAFLNSRLRLRALPGKFCCLTYALFDLEKRHLVLANAGLPYPLLLRGDSLIHVEVGGIPVGMFDRSHYDQAVLTLQPGDRLLFYSDGLPDSLEALKRGREDGGKQVRTMLGQHSADSADELADALLGKLRGRQRQPHELVDDATFLVVQVR